MKTELLGLRKRLRHETLQKLELLKQIKEYRDKESAGTVVKETTKTSLRLTFKIDAGT